MKTTPLPISEKRISLVSNNLHQKKNPNRLRLRFSSFMDGSNFLFHHQLGHPL